jgi:hypothetical protein
MPLTGADADLMAVGPWLAALDLYLFHGRRYEAMAAWQVVAELLRRHLADHPDYAHAWPLLLYYSHP